eukprot:02658_6
MRWDCQDPVSGPQYAWACLTRREIVRCRSCRWRHTAGRPLSASKRHFSEAARACVAIPYPVDALRPLSCRKLIVS